MLQPKEGLYLVSDGDVGALPAVLPCSLHTVLADGFVCDGNSFWQTAIFQNDLRRQRLPKHTIKTITPGSSADTMQTNQQTPLFHFQTQLLMGRRFYNAWPH